MRLLQVPVERGTCKFTSSEAKPRNFHMVGSGATDCQKGDYQEKKYVGQDNNNKDIRGVDLCAFLPKLPRLFVSGRSSPIGVGIL
jgi:hypothetical protein